MPIQQSLIIKTGLHIWKIVESRLHTLTNVGTTAIKAAWNSSHYVAHQCFRPRWSMKMTHQQQQTTIGIQNQQIGISTQICKPPHLSSWLRPMSSRTFLTEKKWNPRKCNYGHLSSWTSSSRTICLLGKSRKRRGNAGIRAHRLRHHLRLWRARPWSSWNQDRSSSRNTKIAV